MELRELDVDVIIGKVRVSAVDIVISNIGHYHCCPRTDDIIAVKPAPVLCNTQLMTCFGPVLATFGSIRIMLEKCPRSSLRNWFKKLDLLMVPRLCIFSLMMFVANNRTETSSD